MDNIQWGSPARRAESQVGLILGVTISITILSFLGVALRLYTRQKILRTFGPDDVAILLAEILSISTLVSTVLQLQKGGLGRHTEFLKPAQFRPQAQTLYANLLLYNAAQIVTKISFLLQYRRIFPSSIIRGLCTYGMVFLGIWEVIQILIITFSCVTIKVIAPNLSSQCISKNAVAYSIAVINVVTDIGIFALPIWPVMQIQISKRRKLHLLIVFSFGFLACAISIIRLHDLILTDNSPDPLWAASAPACWSAVELNLGILCACLPTLRPLFREILPRWIQTSTTGKYYNRNLETISVTAIKTETDARNVMHNDEEVHSAIELSSEMPATHLPTEDGRSWEEIGVSDGHISRKG